MGWELARIAAEDAADGGSDDWGGGLIRELATWFTWACVGLAVLIAAVSLLHLSGRRRAAERDVD